MRDYVISCSALTAGRHLLIDPTHGETLSGGAELVAAVLPRSGKVTVCTMDARLPLDRFSALLAAAARGCNAIFEALDATAVEHAAADLRRRSGGRFLAIGTSGSREADDVDGSGGGSGSDDDVGDGTGGAVDDIDLAGALVAGDAETFDDE